MKRDDQPLNCAVRAGLGICDLARNLKETIVGW